MTVKRFELKLARSIIEAERVRGIIEAERVTHQKRVTALSTLKCELNGTPRSKK